jgi:hypothetical protein
MDIENRACRACFLNKVCHPSLKPQLISIFGKVSDRDIPPFMETACRHSTCEEGKDGARSATKKEGTEKLVYDYESNPKIVQAAEFGTYHKPTHKAKLRIVDTQSGDIYSMQDGNYFTTGQNAYKLD